MLYSEPRTDRESSNVVSVITQFGCGINYLTPKMPLVNEPRLQSRQQVPLRLMVSRPGMHLILSGSIYVAEAVEDFSLCGNHGAIQIASPRYRE